MKLFKPNSRNTGSLLVFKLGYNKSNDKSSGYCLFMEIVKQASWDQATKRASFAENVSRPDTSLIIKLNEIEMGALLAAVESGIEHKGFHQINSKGVNKVTQFSFTPSNTDDNREGLFISVLKDKVYKFNVTLNVAECKYLRTFIQSCFSKINAFDIETNLAPRAQSSAPAPTQREQETEPEAPQDIDPSPTSSYEDPVDENPFGGGGNNPFAL